jgi:four helix bundle protein
MKILRFEDIEAWQAARELVRLVYKAINSNERFKRDFRLASQVQDASVSSMANVAEGFSRKSNKEFIQYLYISKGSAAEVQSHMYVALDQDYASQEDFDAIYRQAEKVSKLDSGFIKYLDSEVRQSKQPK